MSHKTQKLPGGMGTHGIHWAIIVILFTLTQASDAMTFTDLGQVPRKMVIKFNPGLIKPTFKHSFPCLIKNMQLEVTKYCWALIHYKKQ